MQHSQFLSQLSPISSSYHDATQPVPISAISYLQLLSLCNTASSYLSYLLSPALTLCKRASYYLNYLISQAPITCKRASSYLSYLLPPAPFTMQDSKFLSQLSSLSSCFHYLPSPAPIRLKSSMKYAPTPTPPTQQLHAATTQL